MKDTSSKAVPRNVANFGPRRRSRAGQVSIIAALASLILIGLSSAAQAALTWGNKGSKCDGANRIEYARLWGLGMGTDWKAICKATPASGLSALSDGKHPSYCVDKGGLGIWGEWKYSSHASCGARFAAPKPAGCFGPNRQVISARLEGNLGGRSWESACQATGGPDNLGPPNRCVKDALATGIWGEWYTSQSCAKPLQWGNWKDNGCVRDMQRPDANAGGISVEGMRSYSSVLWNVGGDWMEACRNARVDQRMPNNVNLNIPHPTACVVAAADEALGWTAAAILGAGTALIPIPDPVTKAALAGAAIGLASKGTEELLLGVIDTSLNVWGVVWVEDARCGVVQAPPAPSSPAAGNLRSSVPRALSLCPANANAVSGATTCFCPGDRTTLGTVWGTDTYTGDSSICAAARHAGVIGPQGGQVSLQRVNGLQSYIGGARNGVASASYGPWPSSFIFTGPPGMR